MPSSSVQYTEEVGEIKKTICALLVLVVALCLLGGGESEQALLRLAYAGEGCVEVSAESAALLEINSGELLFAHCADKRLPMASTTKIMTALLVLEGGNLEDTVVITDAAVGIEGSSLYLKTGERFTKRELLYGLMLQSGNDAATALAIGTAGSVERFTEKMNLKAAELGLKDTQFQNPHGLSAEGHYTTAKELAQIMAYALQVEGFAEISGTKSIVLEGEGHDTRYLFNHNKLLKCYGGMFAGKTGYTMASGRCLVTAAKRGDMCLVAVTLNDRNDWQDHKAMLDYGFTAFKTVKACDVGERAAIPVTGGRENAVLAETREEKWLCIPTDAVFSRVFDNTAVSAPVKSGDMVATLRYFENGSLVAETPLYAIYSVRK